MRDESHFRLYMPKKEEQSRGVGMLALLIFMAVAFGFIYGSAYVYTHIKHEIRESNKDSTSLINDPISDHQISFFA